LAKAKKEKVISLSLKEIIDILPSRLELVLQEYNSPLELSLNKLLGVTLGEDPVPKKESMRRNRRICMASFLRLNGATLKNGVDSMDPLTDTQVLVDVRAASGLLSKQTWR
jgi:hypothetical protein